MLLAYQGSFKDHSSQTHRLSSNCNTPAFLFTETASYIFIFKLNILKLKQYINTITYGIILKYFHIDYRTGVELIINYSQVSFLTSLLTGSKIPNSQTGSECLQCLPLKVDYLGQNRQIKLSPWRNIEVLTPRKQRRGRR